jgi:hypothetical protein
MQKAAYYATLTAIALALGYITTVAIVVIGSKIIL